MSVIVLLIVIELCISLLMLLYTYHCAQIEIRGVNYTGVVKSSDQNQVSVLVSQLDQNFIKGETHTVMVFATNSVGTSNPLSTLLIVPCELPNTAPYTPSASSNRCLHSANHIHA